MYPVIISVVGVIETIWFMAPMFCFSSSIMMLYVYIISLNDQVSIDELTHLNNRTQLKKYIVSEHSKQGDKTIRYVLMIDLNRFKYINDQFGHIEGDTALKRTADALKIACSDNPFKTFIARYGGDEFIIIAKTESEELVNELSKMIKSIKRTKRCTKKKLREQFLRNNLAGLYRHSALFCPTLKIDINIFRNLVELFIPFDTF